MHTEKCPRRKYAAQWVLQTRHPCKDILGQEATLPALQRPPPCSSQSVYLPLPVVTTVLICNRITYLHSIMVIQPKFKSLNTRFSFACVLNFIWIQSSWSMYSFVFGYFCEIISVVACDYILFTFIALLRDSILMNE